MAKTLGTLAGAIGNKEFYSIKNGNDNAGMKRSAIKQAISTNLVPSAFKIGKPVKKLIAQNELLMKSIVNNQLKASLEYPKMFGALENTVRTLSVAAEITARKIHDNNREFHEAVLAKLTGEKVPTRAAGATRTIPKSRPGKASAPPRTPRGRGGAPTSISGRRAAERAQGLAKQRSPEVLARAARMAQIRRTRMVRGAMIGGAAGVVGGAIAGGLYDAFRGGGGVTTPSGAERTTPSPQTQQTPGGAERSEAPDRPQAGGATLSGVIDLTSQTQGYFDFGSLQGRQGFIMHHTAGRGTAAGIINVFKQRNFPTQFIIDREGKIYQVLPSGRRGQHMKNGEGVGAGLSNANTEGVEVIAKDDSDVLPVQVEAAKRLAQMLGYAPNQVYGHGEVNTHKQRTEGATIIRAIRGDAPPLGAGQRGEASSANLSAEAPSGVVGGRAGYSPINVAGATGEWARDTEFLGEVDRVSRRFGFNPNSLLAVMASESGFDPSIVNPNGGATGLIQFMPNTATGIGTSTAALARMSRAQQMRFVEKFFEPYASGLSGASPGKLYAYVFLPGRANREVLTQAGENYYEQNKGLDMNRDGKITIADLDQRIMQKARERGINLQAPTAQPGAPETATAGPPGAATGQPVTGGRNQPATPAPQPGAQSGAQQQQQSVAGFAMPVDGARLSSGFGQRWGRLHAGLDFAAPTGTPVKASAPGTVIRASDAGGYGNLVEIRHADGTHTRYAHLSAFNTTQGATVSQGQVIGAVGSTGRSTGPHLHFEIRRNGTTPIDPRTVLGGAAPTIQGDQARTATEPGVNQPTAGSPSIRGTPAALPGMPSGMPAGLPGNDLFGLSAMFGMMGMGRPGLFGGVLAVLPLIMRNNVVVNRRRNATGEVPFNMTAASINPIAGIAGLFGQIFRGF